jgi:hypothetical protein
MLLVLLAIGGAVQAGPIYVATTGADFATLLGGPATPIGSPLVTNFSGGDLMANVTSQAFTDGLGNYLYLYQVYNYGAPGSDVVTRFTVSPFGQASASTPLGYLNANIPAAFVVGDQAPLYADVNATAGPTIGFDFPIGNPVYGVPDSFITPGDRSKVLYIKSRLAPGAATGNVIDGYGRTGQVIGPVPEPGTLVLLVTAGLGLLVCVCRKRAA